jgi:hypothetical protein
MTPEWFWNDAAPQTWAFFKIVIAQLKKDSPFDKCVIFFLNRRTIDLLYCSWTLKSLLRIKVCSTKSVIWGSSHTQTSPSYSAYSQRPCKFSKGLQYIFGPFEWGCVKIKNVHVICRMRHSENVILNRRNLFFSVEIVNFHVAAGDMLRQLSTFLTWRVTGRWRQRYAFFLRFFAFFLLHSDSSAEKWCQCYLFFIVSAICIVYCKLSFVPGPEFLIKIVVTFMYGFLKYLSCCCDMYTVFPDCHCQLFTVLRSDISVVTVSNLTKLKIHVKKFKI